MFKKKKKSTFILHLQPKENNNWQGTIKWVEKKKTLQFRSALELIRIIDSTCQPGNGMKMDDLDELKAKSDID
jgi:hypothetical protein